MPRLTLTPAAIRDLHRHHSFLEVLSKKAAGDAIRTIRAGFALLRSQRGIGRVITTDPEAREWTVWFGRAAYRIQYEIRAREIVIMRVRHSREKAPNTLL